MRPWRRSAVVGLLTAGVVSCGGPRMAPSVIPGAPTTVPRELRVRVGGRIVTVAFEDYVAAAALSEFTPTGESPETVARIYEVQTIVARTYALAHLGRHRSEGFDLCDSTHCQLYQPARMAASQFAGDVRRAAARTAGQVLTYGGRPIDALFHADCGGHTTSPQQVWGTPDLPYLTPEVDDPPSVRHRAWTLMLTRDDLAAALGADTRTAVGRRVKSVRLDGTDSSGRVERITVNGDTSVTLRSDDFRNLVNQRLGARAMMSTRFRMSPSGMGYVLSGTGFGHGIGLCQVGALARARRGATPAEIFAAYFPGARLGARSAKLP